MVQVLRAFGCVKVTQEHARGFWCSISDMSNGLTIREVMDQVLEQHSAAGLVKSVKSYHQASNYYIANQNRD